jgi:hypothetical protein
VADGAGLVADFIEELVSKSDGCRARADRRAATSIGTRCALGGEEILARLYVRGLDGRTQGDLLAQALALAPPQGSTAPWARFSSLADHLDAGRPGAAALVDRLYVFSEDAFGFILGLDVMDVLAALGPGAGPASLNDAVERAQGWFPLAPALVARVALEGRWRPDLLVRCRGAERSLASRIIAPLASGPCRFVEAHGAGEIDITCVIAGFPALLIHALGDGR